MNISYEQWKLEITTRDWDKSIYRWLLVEAAPYDWCVRLLKETAE